MFYVKVHITATGKKTTEDGVRKEIPLSIDVYCSAKNTEKGKVIDFGEVTERVKNEIQSLELNELLNDMPTLEYVAEYVCELLPKCYKVKVQDIKGRSVVYTKDAVMKNYHNRK